jgi:hypothetical protein
LLQIIKEDNVIVKRFGLARVSSDPKSLSPFHAEPILHHLALILIGETH